MVSNASGWGKPHGGRQAERGCILCRTGGARHRISPPNKGMKLIQAAHRGNPSMKLQLSLDLVGTDEAPGILGEVGDLIDIAEVGTPTIIRDGMHTVRELRRVFPTIVLLADLKIMDAGEHEATLAFEAGADIATVLGVADDATIRAALAAAGRHGGEIMVDMIGVRDIAARAAEVDRLGVHYVCVHTAFDRQMEGKHPAGELQILKQALQRAQAAVAGGITAATVGPIAALNPAIVVVGGGIMNAPDRRQAALLVREAMQ